MRAGLYRQGKSPFIAAVIDIYPQGLQVNIDSIKTITNRRLTAQLLKPRKWLFMPYKISEMKLRRNVAVRHFENSHHHRTPPLLSGHRKSSSLHQLLQHYGQREIHSFRFCLLKKEYLLRRLYTFLLCHKPTSCFLLKNFNKREIIKKLFLGCVDRNLDD